VVGRPFQAVRPLISTPASHGAMHRGRPDLAFHARLIDLALQAANAAETFP
jgi:hypothetical protein